MDKEKIIALLEKEIEFAKSINAHYQLILGLQQALIVIKREKAN